LVKYKKDDKTGTAYLTNDLILVEKSKVVACTNEEMAFSLTDEVDIMRKGIIVYLFK
jgi:hypothetical protein